MVRSYAADDPEMYAREATQDLPLFAAPQVRTLARRSDPETSRDAAVNIVEHLTELQRRVLAAYREHGRLTPKEVEDLPEFQDLGFSTARKRCSEGLRDGWLRRTGITRDGSDELEAVP
jgi:hypothetical protein